MFLDTYFIINLNICKSDIYDYYSQIHDSEPKPEEVVFNCDNSSKVYEDRVYWTYWCYGVFMKRDLTYTALPSGGSTCIIVTALLGYRACQQEWKQEV